MSKESRRENRRLMRSEIRLVASTVLGLLAGRKVWLPEEASFDSNWIVRAPKRNINFALEYYRDQLQTESSGIEAVRRRAEFALTAVIAAIGLSAAAFERLWAAALDSILVMLLWAFGTSLVSIAILIFAGVSVSSKVLGSIRMSDLVNIRDPRREELRQYFQASQITSRTRRAMVTVFRDGFLLSLLGLTLLAAAHTISWMVEVDVAPSTVTVDIRVKP